MSYTAIMTDSVCGLSVDEGKALDIAVLPMSFIINGKIYYEGVNITHEEFFQKLNDGADVSTSQPSPGDVMDKWDDLLRVYDEIVYIPLSSSLSKAYETATMLARDYDEKIQVIDSRRVSVPQLQLVMDARKLADEGKSALEIKTLLDARALDFGVYIAVDTLSYLRKGGRISGTAAVLGAMLNLKPVLELHGEMLGVYEKQRGMKAAKRAMLAAIHKEIDERFSDPSLQGKIGLQMAYTCMDEEIVNDWEAQIRAEFPDLTLHRGRLPLCTACHIGPGALGIGVSTMLQTSW